VAEIYVLPEAGDYQISIDATGESTGLYNFRLWNGSTAETLVSEVPKTGQLLPKGSALYRLNVNAGDRLYMDSQSASGLGSWQLFDNGNALVGSSSLSSDFENLLKTSGTYYLLLKGNSANTAPLDYTVQVVSSSVANAALSLNTVMGSSITKLGEQDVYTLTGAIGQRLYFDARTGGADLKAKVYSPSGSLVFSGAMNLDGKSFTLLEAGIYKVIIDGEASSTGLYSFRFSEPSAATALVLGQTTGTQGLAGFETKLYQFSGDAGQRVSLANSLPNVSGVEWVLYAPGNQEISPAQLLTVDLDVFLPKTGTYWLAVRNLTATAANFAIQGNAIAAPPVVASGFGIPISGTVASGATNTSTFTANAGTVIYLDHLNNYPVTLKLKQPSGQAIFNTAFYADSSAIQLTQSGTYTLEITPYFSSGSATYSFQVLDLAAMASTVALNQIQVASLSPTTASVYKFEGFAGQKIAYDVTQNAPGNLGIQLLNGFGQLVKTFNIDYFYSDREFVTLQEAGVYYLVLSNTENSARSVRFQLLDNQAGNSPVVFGETISGNIVDGRESQTFKFSGVEGQRIFVDALNGSPRVWLYNTNDQLIENFDLTDRIITLPNTGEYLMRIEGNGYPTSYQFKLTAPTAAISSLVLGTAYNGEIADPADVKAYQFTGSAGQRVYFDGIGASSYSPKAVLFSPNGSAPFGYNYYTGIKTYGLYEDSDIITLSEDGVYTLYVTADTGGSYRFAVWDVDANAESVSLNVQTPVVNVTGNEAKFLKFNAVEGQYIFIEKTGSLEANVYDAVNGRRLSPDNGTSEEFLVPVTGSYVLKLKYGYNVSTQIKIVTPTQLLDVRDPKQQIFGAISQPGERDFYTFTGAVGDRFLLDQVLGSSNFVLTIQTPSGAVIYSQGMDSESAAPFTLQEGGEYRIKIDAREGFTGQYGFRAA
jgi:large repetitive protein